MPRARKEVAPGEPYGQRQALEQMQDAAPMASGMDLHASAVAGAFNMQPPPPGGILGQPTGRPNEPITAGLGIGAGPGPEVLPQLNMREHKVTDQLMRAAEITGNPKLAEMARRSRRPVGRQLPRGRPLS